MSGSMLEFREDNSSKTIPHTPLGPAWAWLFGVMPSREINLSSPPTDGRAKNSDHEQQRWRQGWMAPAPLWSLSRNVQSQDPQFLTDVHMADVQRGPTGVQSHKGPTSGLVDRQ